MPLETLIHESWLRHWAPALIDPKLRAGMFNSSRLAGRVERDLLEAQFGSAHGDGDDEAMAAQLDRILQRATGDVLSQVGLAWFAPVLARDVIGRERRSGIFSLTREELQMMLSYRDHLPAASFAASPETDREVEEAGEACLQAWVKQLPSPIAERGLLRLKRTEDAPDHPDLDPARSALFARVSADLRLGEEIAE